jgi:hypothetical protein
MQFVYLVFDSIAFAPGGNVSKSYSIQLIGTPVVLGQTGFAQP